MHRSPSRRVVFAFFSILLTPLAASAAVNLRVDATNVSQSSVNAGGEVMFYTTVTNIGDEHTTATVYVHLSPDADGTDNAWLTFNFSPVLAPGATATVAQTVTLPSPMATGSYYLAAQAQGWYPDVDTSDNWAVLGIYVNGANCSADAFEQNDSHGAARPIATNDILSLNHCDDPDDWFSFAGVAGTRYGAQANTSSSQRLALAIYAADGTMLATTTEHTSNPRLIWTAPANGTYYVRARPFSGFHNVGPNTAYTLVVADVLPDLIMPSSDTSPIQAIAGGTAWFYTAVGNFGFTDSGAFDVGIHLSANPNVTRNDTRVGYRRVNGLPANNSADIGGALIAFPSDLPAGTYYLAAIADDTDQVAEYEEDNNRSEITPVSVTGPSCTPDLYENDDLISMARPIGLNEQQSHNLCEDGFDWFYFDATAGRTYYLRSTYPAAYPGGPTTPTGGIELYDANGQRLAETNDVLAWTAPQSGRYYALVRGGLSAKDYTFALLDQLPDLAAVPYYAMDQTVAPRGGVLDQPSYSVRNFGFVDAPASTVGFYLSTDATITSTDTLVTTEPLASIPPNGQVTKFPISVPIPRTQAPGLYQLGAYADVRNSVVEFDETNNGYPLWQIQVIEPPCAPDGYDDDDTSDQAKPLTLNEAQSRNMCDDGYDWVSVNLQAGTTYSFEATGEVAPHPVIYDTDGRSVLVNEAAFGWSAITAPSTGRYYVMATTRDISGRAHWGNSTNYTLRMTTCAPDAFEHDDTDRSIGKPIAVGDSQARNHCDDGIDWAVLTLTAPGNYTISTGNIGALTDTVIEIHTATSSWPLALNDNLSVNNKASSITYNFATAGTYYIKVIGKQRGADTGYTLSVRAAKGRK